MNTTAPEAGSTIHFLRSISILNSHGFGEVVRRGQMVTITTGLLEANEDREGRSLFALTEEEQTARYGEPVWALGDVPEDFVATLVGTIDHDDARQEARRVALAIASTPERHAALAAVEAKYGRITNPSNQRSTFSAGDEERDRELRAAGLK